MLSLHFCCIVEHVRHPFFLLLLLLAKVTHLVINPFVFRGQISLLKSQRHRRRRRCRCCCIPTFSFSHHTQPLICKALLSRCFRLADIHALEGVGSWRRRIDRHHWNCGGGLRLLLLLLERFLLLLLLMLF